MAKFDDVPRAFRKEDNVLSDCFINTLPASMAVQVRVNYQRNMDRNKVTGTQLLA